MPTSASLPPPKSYSLRNRLIWTTLGSSIAVGLISTAIVLALAWKEVNDTFDDLLEEGARLVLALGEGATDQNPQADPRAPSPALRLDYQILSPDGRILARGHDAPRKPFVPEGARHDRFYDVSVKGERWRVYVRVHDKQGFSVQIGQEWDDRNDLIFETLESLAWPLAGLWLLLALVNGWLVHRLVAPLGRMARHLQERSAGDLSALTYDGRAREIQTVVMALNQLLDRVTHTLEGERRFTADAAHELRTPLAALASRIQLLQRSLPAECAQAAAPHLRRLRSDVARSTALVQSLLQLARLDPQSAEALLTDQVDVAELMREAMRAYAPDAEARGVTISLDCRVDTLVGNHEALLTAVRNLLHNAIVYGRPGGQVALSAVRQGETVVLTVSDDGDGVAPPDLERLGQRFFRVLGNEAPGSGLGLSIAARVAELHRGTLQFTHGLNGLGLGAQLVLPGQPEAKP